MKTPGFKIICTNEVRNVFGDNQALIKNNLAIRRIYLATIISAPSLRTLRLDFFYHRDREEFAPNDPLKKCAEEEE